MASDKEMMRSIVRETVHETLTGLGFNPERPHDMQADFAYMRTMRQGSEFLSRCIKATSITVVIPSLLYLLWETLKQTLEK